MSSVINNHFPISVWTTPWSDHKPVCFKAFHRKAWHDLFAVPILILDFWYFHLVLLTFNIPIDLEPSRLFLTFVDIALVGVSLTWVSRPLCIATFLQPVDNTPTIIPAAYHISYHFSSTFLFFSYRKVRIFCTFERNPHKFGISYLTSDFISPNKVMAINLWSFTFPNFGFHSCYVAIEKLWEALIQGYKFSLLLFYKRCEFMLSFCNALRQCFTSFLTNLKIFRQ